MASNEERKAFIVAQLKKLAQAHHGDAEAWPELFAEYDQDDDGALTKAETKALFKDAGIGGGFVGAWVSGVFANLDDDKNDKLTRAELERAIASSPPPVKSPLGNPPFRVPPPLPKVPPVAAAAPNDITSQLLVGVLVGVVTMAIMRNAR